MSAHAIATVKAVHEFFCVVAFSAATLSLWSKINGPLYTVLLLLNIAYVYRKLRKKK